MTEMQTFLYAVGVAAVIIAALKLIGVPSLWWSTRRGFYWE